jgi:hypothetical protein
MRYEYGDKVLATYPPTAEDPQPRMREAVVVDPGFGDGLYEVFFGTLEEYDALVEADGIEVANGLCGVFYPSEMVPA